MEKKKEYLSLEDLEKVLSITDKYASLDIVVDREDLQNVRAFLSSSFFSLSEYYNVLEFNQEDFEYRFSEEAYKQECLFLETSLEYINFLLLFLYVDVIFEKVTKNSVQTVLENYTGIMEGSLPSLEFSEEEKEDFSNYFKNAPKELLKKGMIHLLLELENNDYLS